MNFKTNLLTAAIAASFLTACGGSSNSGSSDPVVDPAPAEPTPDPVELLDYTLTTAEIQGLGKAFVAGLDAQAAQLSTGLGKLAGDVMGAVVETEEQDDGEIEIDGLKQGLHYSLNALMALKNYGTVLREVGEVGLEAYNDMYEYGPRKMELEPRPGGYVLGTIYEDDNDKFQFLEDASGNLQLNTQTAFEYNQNEIAVSNYTFTYIKSSSTTAQLLVSGTLVDSETGLDVTLTNASFAAESLISGSKANFSLDNVTVLIGDVTVSASAGAEFVVGGIGAEMGTLSVLEEAITFGSSEGFTAEAISALTGVDDNNDGEMLNLVSLEIADLRIEAASGEYLTADSILFEDADAADYLGDDGYGAIADFEYSEDKNILTVSNYLGSTVYTFTPATGELPPVPTKSDKVAAIETPVEYVSAKISCITESNNFIASAPKFTYITCSEDNAETGYGSLVSLVGSHGYNVSTGNNRYGIDTSELRDENSGELMARKRIGVDAIIEPITFSVAANGEIGLAGGLTVPYQFNLNHPGAYNYQAEAVIGLAPTALTANFSTLEENVVIATAVPFVPADAAYAPTEAVIKFSYNWNDPEGNEETGITTLGALTVNGITVATLTESDNVNGRALENGQKPYVLTFTDGSYPASGGLFSTVEDMMYVDCPEPPVEEGEPAMAKMVSECTEDQSGVVDTTSITNLFFEGMPTTGPFFEPVIVEAPEPK
jgi:hypothetical protein